MKLLRPLTPKEFSEAIGGLLSPKTVRLRCRRGAIRSVTAGRQYLIPWSEVERFTPQPSFITRFLVTL